MKIKIHKIVLSAAILSISTAAVAEGHYVPGIEGVKAASVPPPGNYFIGYQVNYDFNLKAPGTSKDIPNTDGKVNALALRAVHISKKKILGADYGVEAIVPIIRKDFDFTNSKDTGIGDVYVGPLVLGWHGNRWDAVAAAGLWLDTGSDSKPTKAGNGYKSTMLTGGVTGYLNQEKSLSASALARYELHGKNDAGYEPGDQLTIEWGVGKKVTDTLELGLVGYDQWQMTKDKGGANGDKFSKHAIGLEASYLSKSLGGFIKGAYYHEYDASAGSGPLPSGDTFRLTLVKPF